MNTFTLDGQTGSDADLVDRFNGATSMDAIAEVRVLLNNYQAEYGRNAGAFVNIVSKSGTREFHGSALLTSSGTNSSTPTTSSTTSADRRSPCTATTRSAEPSADRCSFRRYSTATGTSCSFSIHAKTGGSVNRATRAR